VEAAIVSKLVFTARTTVVVICMVVGGGLVLFSCALPLLIVPAVGVLLIPTILAGQTMRQAVAYGGRCKACAYDLRGLAHDATSRVTCPECGLTQRLPVIAAAPDGTGADHPASRV
jgi:hypothetical protein